MSCMRSNLGEARRVFGSEGGWAQHVRLESGPPAHPAVRSEMRDEWQDQDRLRMASNGGER
jgi:hypothetical protein